MNKSWLSWCVFVFHTALFVIVSVGQVPSRSLNARSLGHVEGQAAVSSLSPTRTGHRLGTWMFEETEETEEIEQVREKIQAEEDDGHASLWRATSWLDGAHLPLDRLRVLLGRAPPRSRLSSTALAARASVLLGVGLPSRGPPTSPAGA